MPDAPLLVPGLGAQGGDLDALAAANRSAPDVINVSRGILYAGDERGNPFEWLTEIDCPVRLSTAERSASIHKDMVSRAVALIPVVSQWSFDGVGHCVAQEAPALLLQALELFEAEAG